jgi:hypothetical protein
MAQQQQQQQHQPILLINILSIPEFIINNDGTEISTIFNQSPQQGTSSSSQTPPVDAPTSSPQRSLAERAYSWYEWGTSSNAVGDSKKLATNKNVNISALLQTYENLTGTPHPLRLLFKIMDHFKNINNNNNNNNTIQLHLIQMECAILAQYGCTADDQGIYYIDFNF